MTKGPPASQEENDIVTDVPITFDDDDDTTTNTTTTIGRYHVVKRLGAGGMAEVFLARHRGPGGFEKTVVIKRCFPHLAEDPKYIDMFLREAKIAASLNHPNVVHVHELGEDHGLYFIAMEHVDGLPLHRLARRAWHLGRSLPVEVIIRAIADASLGLHHAHTRANDEGEIAGLVHRDVSPDNLMITRSGMTKVVDFGIAKDSTSHSVTKTGEIKGKIPFMSPEQIQGQAVDARSDLYALGVCFYWLLTGKRPFTGASDFAIMQSILETTAKAPSFENPSVPQEVDDVVAKLLAKDPTQRFQNGQELHDLLMSFLNADRAASARFVVEVADADLDDDGERRPLTLTDGFIAATPVSQRFRRDIAAGTLTPIKKKSSSLPIAAAIFFGLTLFAAAFYFSRSDKEPVLASAPPLQEAPPPTPPPVVPPIIVRTRTEEVPAVTSKPKPTSKKATKFYADVEGPALLRWRSKERFVKAKRVQIMRGQKSIVVKNPRRGFQAKVPIIDGVANYRALGTGKVDFRVHPWAEVYLGKEKLGTTPFNKPPQLVAGTYRVRFVHKGEAKTRTIVVVANEKMRVNVRF